MCGLHQTFNNFIQDMHKIFGICCFAFHINKIYVGACPEVVKCPQCNLEIFCNDFNEMPKIYDTYAFNVLKLLFSSIVIGQNFRDGAKVSEGGKLFQGGQ